MGVDVFMVLVLCLSKGLLILERGAKIPERKEKQKVYVYKSQKIVGVSKIYRVMTDNFLGLEKIPLRTQLDHLGLINQ